jgi:hypothetical protein
MLNKGPKEVMKIIFFPSNFQTKHCSIFHKPFAMVDVFNDIKRVGGKDLVNNFIHFNVSAFYTHCKFIRPSLNLLDSLLKRYTLFFDQG